MYTSRVMITAALAVIALSATACYGDSGVTTTVTATVTDTTASTSAEHQDVQLHAGVEPGGNTFVVCNGVSGIATSMTSCPFAIRVSEAYGRPLRQEIVTVSAYSPVTQQTYEMHCEPGSFVTISGDEKRAAVICSGGNNAKVVVF